MSQVDPKTERLSTYSNLLDYENTEYNEKFNAPDIYRPEFFMRKNTLYWSCTVPGCDFMCRENSHKKRSHQLSHEGKKPFTCPVCDFSSTTKFGVKHHCLKQHPKIAHTVYPEIGGIPDVIVKEDESR